jgi:hypothetical protein
MARDAFGFAEDIAYESCKRPASWQLDAGRLILMRDGRCRRHRAELGTGFECQA